MKKKSMPSMDDILNWIGEHEQVAKDFDRHFKTHLFEDKPVEDKCIMIHAYQMDDDGWMMDIVDYGNGYKEAWIYHCGYGGKQLMFGSKSDDIDSFAQTAIMSYCNHKQCYYDLVISEYEDLWAFERGEKE